MKFPDDLSTLIKKYQSGIATAEEKRILNEWYHSFNDDVANVQAGDSLTESELANRIQLRLLQTIHQREKGKVKSIRLRWQYVAAAVIIFIIFSAGIYFVLSSKDTTQQVVKTTMPAVQPLNNDVAPGGNKALLTLADGSTIVLDTAANGTIGVQGNIQVEKLSNGMIAYSIGGKQVTENDEAFYNTISTPRGGQYKVLLSDGTQVWLNAASSIRYPVVFTGASRNVEVTGETYFEVAKNESKPFRVKTATSEIEVLGTHFNVNAYDDEPSVKTTLLEGAVKVSLASANADKKQIFLKPGQQSAVSKTGQINLLNNADTETVMAWKNGRFQFRSSDIQSMLRQISRWYDVDIEYKGKVNLHFTGQLTRNEYVSSVLEKLALTEEVHFKIEGKKIIVTR